MSKIEVAVSYAEGIAADDSHGYDQPGRMGQDFDCSSLVGRSLVHAGFNYPSSFSPSTREMKAHLERIGFKWHNGISGVKRGDILWKSGHTAFATSSTRIVEACINERGGISGGRVGDQTGSEIRTANINNYNWSGYWRAPEEAEEDMTDEERGWLKSIYTEVTRTDDPSGRGVKMTTHEHLKWMAGKQAEIAESLAQVAETSKVIADGMAKLTASLEAEQKADETDK